MKCNLHFLAGLALLIGLLLPAGDPWPVPARLPDVSLAHTAPAPPVDSTIVSTPTFTDVAPVMGASAPGYGTGTAWGDYDSDGDLDLYVVNLGYGGSGQPNVLLRNDGIVFTDVSAETGVNDGGPGVAAVWGNFDNLSIETTCRGLSA